VIVIRCGCGTWLAEVETPGQELTLHLSRCRRCHKRQRPSYPVATVRPDGSYDLAMLARPGRLAERIGSG
jgi:hypothetical protein